MECVKSVVIGKGSLYISGISVKESLSLLYNIVDRESIFIMETQQLVDLGKQMNLEGEELREFVRSEQALASKSFIS